MNISTSLKLLGFPWEASSCLEWCQFEGLLRITFGHQLWSPEHPEPASRTSAAPAALNGVSDKVSWLQNGIIFSLCWIFTLKTRSEMPSSGIAQLEHFIRNALLLFRDMFGSKTWRVWTEKKAFIIQLWKNQRVFLPQPSKITKSTDLCIIQCFPSSDCNHLSLLF